MNEDDARKIIAHVTKQRLRWGKNYTGDEYTSHTIMDAMVAINGALAGVQDDLVPKADLSKANRQMAAAKARETKLRNQIEDLEQVIKDFTDVVIL